MINLNSFTNLQECLEKALPPKEGETRDFKDGKYKFTEGHWRKIKIEENYFDLKETKISKNGEEKIKFENLNGDEMIGIITELEPILKINGFKISFRIYNIKEKIGGFETTLWVKDAPFSIAKIFVGDKIDYKHAEKLTNSKIISRKINNKVPIKYQFKEYFKNK